MILLETWLSQTLSSSLVLAIPIAVLAGLISFASPCILPLLPGYLSYASGLGAAEITDGTGNRRLLVLGTLGFILGFAVVFILTGTLLGGLGAVLLTHERLITTLAGILIIVMGAGFLGWLPMPAQRRPHTARAGALASPLLGLAFGLGWTPCIGPTLSIVLTLALNEGSATRGGLLAFAYAMGLGLPFMAFAVAFTKLAPHLDWLKRHQRNLQRIGGGLLLLVGISMVTGLWTILVAHLRQWASTFGTIL